MIQINRIRANKQKLEWIENLFIEHAGFYIPFLGAGLELAKKELDRGIKQKSLNTEPLVNFVNQLRNIKALIQKQSKISLDPRIRLYEINAEKGYLSAPVEVMVELTDACNLSCFYCSVGNNAGDIGATMTTKELLSLLDGVLNVGVGQITFTGGEPFLREKSHQDFFRAIRKCKKAGARVVIFTNGTLIKQFQEELKNVKVDQINVSLDTVSSQMFQEITQKNLFDNVIKGLKILQNLNIQTRMSTVVVSYNQHEFKDIVKTYQNLNLPALAFIRGLPLGRACDSPSEILDRNGWNEFTKEVTEYCREKGLKTWDARNLGNTYFPFGTCRAGTSFCIINPDLTISPCTAFKQHIVDSLRNKDFGQVWTSDNFENYRRKEHKCPFDHRDVVTVYS